MIGLVGLGTVWMIRHLDMELIGSADQVIEWKLKKIDFYQGRYSSADGVADLDSTVPDRSRRLRAGISADGASFNSFNQFNSVT